MMTTLRLSAMIAATALLAACGGGGGGSPSPSVPPPTGSNPDNPSNPAPTNDALQYKGYIQASLKTFVLGVDDVAKTLYQLPAKIKADVEAHPFTHTPCDSTCVPGAVDTSQWVTFPVTDGGTARLEDWQDRSPESESSDLIFNEADSVRLDLIGIRTPRGSQITTASHILTNSLPYPYSIGLAANHELTRDGLTINGTASPIYRGGMVVKLVDGRYEIADTVEGAEVNRDLIVVEKNDAGVTTHSWMAAFNASTNQNDLDQVSFDIDMINGVGGATLKLKSVQPLNFGDVAGKLQIESGAFTYEFTDANQGMHFALRVSVDADPAYLNVEIDENADGTYEKSGRLTQADFDYSF